MTETLEIPEIVPQDNAVPNVNYDGELYKKWFKAGGQAGFLSITPFFKEDRFVGKFIIDVGKVDPNSNQILSSTKCYIDGLQLLVYLDAVVGGTAANLFYKRSGVNSPESFIAYGGSAGADPIARVFKVEYWGATKDTIGDSKAFVWKCGHFKGNVTNTGAITAIMSEVLSADMIKVSRLEMTEIAWRVKLAMIGFASDNSRWYES